MTRLLDIQHTFDMEIRNNDFAKDLKKIFKKKLKITKIKFDDNDGRLRSFVVFIIIMTLYTLYILIHIYCVL